MDNWNGDIFFVDNLIDSLVKSVASSWFESNWCGTEKLVALIVDLVLRNTFWMILLKEFLSELFSKSNLSFELLGFSLSIMDKLLLCSSGFFVEILLLGLQPLKLIFELSELVCSISVMLISSIKDLLKLDFDLSSIILCVVLT